MAVFVDTGAWFAYFVRRDPDHPAAVAWMRKPLYEFLKGNEKM